MSRHKHEMGDALPPKVEKGIRDTIGRKMKVTLKKMVKLEKGNDQLEGKVLTLTPDRCFILGVRSPFKVESSFHFLDIKSMDSPSTDRLNISTANGKIYFLHMIGTDDADNIIGRIALSLRTIFPGVSLSRIVKASLEPVNRQKSIQQKLNQADLSETGPCGNFSVMYECMCNYHGLPVREEVGWDVDTIYLSQNCKELNLKDFDLPDHKDYMPILAVLMYNRWFEGLIVKNMKLSNDVLEIILKVVKTSNTLKSLVLDGVGLKGDIALKLGQEMVENKECSITVLDLSSNPLEDRAVMHLSGSLPVLRQGGGLKVFKIDRTGLTAKGVSGLCQALRSSPLITKSLTTLTLSDNCIRGEEASGLYNYLSTPNNLVHLDISGTDCAVEIYISAMSKGCIDKLKTVCLARNFFYGKGITARPPHYIEDEYTGNRKNKDTVLPNTFQEYFKTTKALTSIDLSGMKVPQEAVKQLMDGLRQNFTEGLEVSINLSCAELRSSGAQVIGAVIGQLTNVVGLDLTDNGFDADLSKLLAWVQQNKSLKELKIGRNFNGIKPKHMRAVMDSIVELVQEEGSCLESLYLNDSRLKEWSTVILGCLGSNTSLSTIDISGNMIGDAGARVLAKALQINSRIRVLVLDRNLISANGFNEIAVALEKNYSLRYMPYPVNDAVAAMKSQPEKTQSSLAKIQDLLLRNSNSNKNSNDQQFRLQQAVATTAQEVLDRVAEKVEDTLNALELLDAATVRTDVAIKAKGLVKDAKSSKQILSDIYGLGMEMTSGDHSNLTSNLNEMARDMDAMVQRHVKNTVNAMTKNAESQCPHIFQDIRQDVEDKAAEKSDFPENFVKDRVISQTSKEIVNKISELNLAVATLISDKVADTLLTALSQCNTTLTEQLAKKKQEQAAAREQLFLKAEEEKKKKEKFRKRLVNKNLGSKQLQVHIKMPTTTKARRSRSRSKSPTPKATTDAPQKEEAKKEEVKVEKKPAENILPDMRKERAASIARRKQRPISNPALDLEYKKKAEDQVTSPRSASPIPEAAAESANSQEEEEDSKEVKLEVEDEKLKEDEEHKTVATDEQQQEKEVEEHGEQEEEGEESQEEEENKEKQESEEEQEDKEEKQEDMVTSGSLKEPKEDDVSDGSEKASDDFDDLPSLPTSKKLEHVTKGRARPNRRGQRKPVAKESDTDASVDDFFSTTVSSTDFDKVPTLDEEKKLAVKEKTPKKPMGIGLPGMGGMGITPDMLRRRRKTDDDEDKAKEKKDEQTSKADSEDHKDENGEGGEEESPKSPEPVTKRRPPGAMGLPGMGFGSNVLAEMKLKKLNKSKAADTNQEKTENSKPDSEQSSLPFGRSMLKKTNHSASTPPEKKEEVTNSNNNNNKESAQRRSASARWKSRSFEKVDKPTISAKPATKTPLMPGKPSPPPSSSKPSRGAPPPLPSKPKPALKPDSLSRGSRSRPMSEYVDPKRVPSSVKNRVSSWAKKDNEDKK